MVTINITGNVSAQAAAGETVTFTITKPDATVDTLTAVTLDDLSFAATTTYTDAGDYTIVAAVGADAAFLAATSAVVTFNVPTVLAPRTITVTAAVA